MEDMLIELDLGHKRPVTITITIWEKEFMLKGEADIGLLPGTIPPLTKVNLVDC